MVLQIAGIRIKTIISSEYKIQSDYFNTIVKWYGTASSESWDFEIRLEPESLFFDLNENIMERRNGLLYSETDNTFIFKTDSSTVHIDWRDKMMRLAFDHAIKGDPIDVLFVWNLKLLISLLVLQAGGLPCHCSAVYNNHYSIVFSGRPRAGKTTIALLLKKKFEIYNDELNIIRPYSDTFYTFSTPFTSPEKLMFCSPGFSPLKKIFFLRHAQTNYTRPMSYKEKYFSLLGSAYTLPTSAYFADILMKNCENISNTIPIEMLYFNYMSNIAEKINNFIQGEA